MSTSSPESQQVVKLDLSAGSIHATLIDGLPHIVLKSAVEDLGLDYSTQLAKLKTRSWASVGQSPMQMPGDDQVRSVTVVPVRTFLMLLATVNENRVKAAVRKTLVAFQNETADAIESYWTKGAALNPRTDETPQPPREIAAAGPVPYKEQAEIVAVLAQAGVLPHQYATATAKIIVARSMGERPALDPSETPLYAATFLAEKGHPAKVVEKFQSGFGARVSNHYLKVHGRRPEKVPGPAGSRIDKVVAYTEEDRPLLDQVYAGMADLIEAFEVEQAGGQLALAGGAR